MTLTQPPKLLDRVRTTLRTQHYSYRTEQAYVDWTKRFILFHDKQHPQSLNTPEIEEFLTHLALEQHVSPSTQNQALAALLFLYHHVLQIELERPPDAVRARKSQRLPTILTKAEISRILPHLREPYLLMTNLLYGGGLRVSECLQLRVMDLDFEQRQLMVRRGKGNKDRVTMLPDCLHPALQRQLDYARSLHQRDLAQGYGRVELPYALDRKYPQADREWRWQYVFPSYKLSKNPRTGQIGRHHWHQDPLQRAIKQAAKLANINKRVSSHVFRHSFGRPFGRLVNISLDVTRYLERVFSPWRWRGPSISSLVSFQGT